jgi:hypothetical protein
MLAGIAVGPHTPGFVADAERAWLQEFGAAFTCDPLDEASDALLRAIHAGL